MATQTDLPPTVPSSAPPTDPTNRPRLHRSRDERLLFGVCGGLAERFGLDPTLVRVGFVLGALFPPTSGVSILGYALLAVILPQEGTEDLAARERVRRNLEELRSEVSTLAETVRARVPGAARDRRSPAGPTDAAGDRRRMGYDLDARSAVPDGEAGRPTGTAR